MNYKIITTTKNGIKNENFIFESKDTKHKKQKLEKKVKT